MYLQALRALSVMSHKYRGILQQVKTKEDDV